MYMRYSFRALIVMLMFSGVFITGCDLLDQTVLIDDGLKNTVSDSTTIRRMGSVSDSTQLAINATANWHAIVKDSAWCSLSKYDGVKGADTIMIHVTDNPETVQRQTTITIESGTEVRIFRLIQNAGDGWLAKPYWNRTAAQRAGLHGMVKDMIVPDGRHSKKSNEYTFDQRGNLLVHKSMNNNLYDTVYTYTYDASDHRLTGRVTDADNKVVREWNYEYKNTGQLVAYSAEGWNDPDPLADDMHGMIVPDLSAVSGRWSDGGFEFHERRTYSFDEYRLIIISDRWKVNGSGDSIHMACDTMRVSYNFSTINKLYLPYRNSYVTNSTYRSNGMLETMKTRTDDYRFLNNIHRMAVESYRYIGDAAAAHKIESYDCTYNLNADLVEQTITYSGSESGSMEKYPYYEYDDNHNWTSRYQEMYTIDEDSVHQTSGYTYRREIIYY